MPDSSLAERIYNLPSVSTTIAESLADMIYGGSLQPGERLVQAKLAEQFGVSRLPVRDALRLLEQQSLVVTRPRRGMIVRPLDPQELREAFFLRKVLEPLAMEEAAPRATPSDLARLEELVSKQERSLQAGDMAAVVRLDQQFHEAIFALAGNRILREMIQSLWKRTHQARSVVRISEQGRTIGEKSVSRHRELLCAMRDGEAALARSATVEIISAAEREILAELEQLGWIDATGTSG